MCALDGYEIHDLNNLNAFAATRIIAESFVVNNELCSHLGFAIEPLARMLRLRDFLKDLISSGCSFVVCEKGQSEKILAVGLAKDLPTEHDEQEIPMVRK